MISTDRMETTEYMNIRVRTTIHATETVLQIRVAITTTAAITAVRYKTIFTQTEVAVTAKAAALNTTEIIPDTEEQQTVITIAVSLPARTLNQRVRQSLTIPTNAENPAQITADKQQLHLLQEKTIADNRKYRDNPRNQASHRTVINLRDNLNHAQVFKVPAEDKRK